MYVRTAAKVWAVLVVIGVAAWFVYALPRGLCDTSTCPTDDWLAPVLIGLAGLGLATTVVLVWFLPRWNKKGTREDHDGPPARANFGKSVDDRSE
jgi:hypothetical protein